MCGCLCFCDCVYVCVCVYVYVYVCMCVRAVCARALGSTIHPSLTHPFKRSPTMLIAALNPLLDDAFELLDRRALASARPSSVCSQAT